MGMTAGKWIRKRGKKKRGRETSKARADRFYNSYEWLELRADVLMHYGRECMLCGKTSGPMNVDHIRPRTVYPHLELEFSNMQVLCPPCNKGKGNRTFDLRRRKDGATIPTSGRRHNDPWNKNRLVAASFTPAELTCRVYMCGKATEDQTGYCAEHKSNLRPGKAPGTPGCSPVILRKAGSHK